MTARRPNPIYRLVPVLSALLLACSTGEAPAPTPTQTAAPSVALGPVATVAASVVEAPTPLPGPDYGILMPDIAVTTPRELYVEVTGAGRDLRFSTTVSNVGAGPLEILGEFSEEENRAFATQLLHRSDGTPFQHQVGTLDFDGGHGHWHLEDFMTFELWTYAENGALDEMLASTGKVSFCLLDFTTVDPPLAHAAIRPLFDQCHWTRQGLSPGWEETYAAWLPGQELDITDIPDGRYVVLTILDPENRIVDSNHLNHTVAVYIELSGNAVRVLEPTEES